MIRYTDYIFCLHESNKLDKLSDVLRILFMRECIFLIRFFVGFCSNYCEHNGLGDWWAIFHERKFNFTDFQMAVKICVVCM